VFSKFMYHFIVQAVNIANRSVKPIFKSMSLLSSIILEGNPRMLGFEGQVDFVKKVTPSDSFFII